MYHCRLYIYLVGDSKGTFDVFKNMPPLENFSHEFMESSVPEETLTTKADVIIADLCDMEIAKAKKLIEKKRMDAQIILLVKKEQISLLAGDLSAVTDIWTLPMSDDEIRFRFLRWQQTCKMNKDFWQANQYLETTINSVPNLIWYKDKDGLHEKVNDSFCKTVNKTKKQVEGRDHYYIWDVDPEDDANASGDCMESDREVMRKKKICVSEEVVKAGDDVRLLTTYKSPLYDLDGSVMGTVGIGIDVTQERAYEKEIMQKSSALETIFTSLDCGVICHTLDGKHVISVNQAALKILGYNSKEDLEECGFAMISPSVILEDRPRLKSCISTLKKVGDSVNVEYRIRHEDGEVLHVMGSIKLIQENGEVFYQRFLLDCTAQKLQEEKEKRHQTELIQALSSDYKLVFNFNLDTGEGVLLRADNDSLSMFGAFFDGEITLEESMGHYIEKLVYKDDKEMLKGACSQDKLKEELEKRDLYYVSYRTFIDGEVRYYEMKVARTGTWSESHDIVLGFRSVDEQARNEKEQKRLLEDALLQANKANKAKSLFLSNMSHDIRTPMNAIIGFTTLAISRIDNKDKVKEYLEKINVSGKHMLSLINDVLDMSWIESGKAQLEETACNLHDVINDLYNMVQVNIQDKHLKIHTETANIINDKFYCDTLRLSQVLLNVLSNSVKYTNPGGEIYLKVTEKPAPQKGYANYEFSVSDTGIGMSDEFISRIYEPFEREQNTTLSGVQGAGLGMAIIKNIVDLMGGTIHVESKQGVGTKVVLSFTFCICADEDNEIAATKEEDEYLLPESGAVCSGRILMAEDNELNQEIAVEILKDAGFEIDVASNGNIAVDMLKDSEPGYYDLVLMDIQMPVMNGYDAARAIRKLENEKLASIPIFAMTANAFEEDKLEALKSGMNGHIAKPVDAKKLLNILQKVIG